MMARMADTRTRPRREDFWHDADAPTPTSVIPGATVIVTDASNQLLLMIERTDNGNFALPGGVFQLGETIAETAVRECEEETGYVIEIDELVGTFTNPAAVVQFNTEHPEVRQEFSLLYEAHIVGGEERASSESRQVVWVENDADVLTQLPMASSMRYRLAVWNDEPRPFLG